MNTMKYQRHIVKILIFFFIGVSQSVLAEGLDDITIMGLGPVDGRAVIKTADGKMQVLAVGDTVSGTTATVSQILNDRLVVVEQPDPAKPKQTVWIYKPTSVGGKSRVQRLDPNGPAPRITAAQVVNQPDKPAAK